MKNARQILQLTFSWFLILTPNALRAEGPSPGNVLEQFKVGKKGDRLMVPVTIQQRTYSFGLDTGSSMSAFDTSMRSIVGESLVEVTAQSPENTTVNIYKTPRASLGRLQLKEGAPAALVDLSRFSSLTGYDISGYIGMDFLVGHVVQINFDQGRVYFLRSPGEDPGVAVPLIIEDEDNPVPAVEVTVANSRTERFQLDTGFYGFGYIRKDLCIGLARNKSLRIIGGGRDMTAAGEKETAIVRLNQIRLGEFEHSDLIFSAGFRSLLGLAYLSRFVITFDFPHRKMYLKKGERFSAKDELDMSGIFLMRNEGKTIVLDVAESSPAAAAGVRRKDRILKIGDESADQFSLHHIRCLLASPGNDIVVHLSRDGKEIDVPLLLRDYWTGYAAAWQDALENPGNTLKRGNAQSIAR